MSVWLKSGVWWFVPPEPPHRTALDDAVELTTQLQEAEQGANLSCPSPSNLGWTIWTAFTHASKTEIRRRAMKVFKRYIYKSKGVSFFFSVGKKINQIGFNSCLWEHELQRQMENWGLTSFYSLFSLQDTTVTLVILQALTSHRRMLIALFVVIIPYQGEQFTQPHAGSV